MDVVFAIVAMAIFVGANAYFGYAHWALFKHEQGNQQVHRYQLLTPLTRAFFLTSITIGFLAFAAALVSYFEALWLTRAVVLIGAVLIFMYGRGVKAKIPEQPQGV